MQPALQQVNVSYVPIEDRLLLKVRSADDNEYRLWLTRRFTGLLLQVLHEQIEKLGGPQELVSRRETRGLLKDGALAQPWEAPANPIYPLGEQGVLGFRINVSRNEADLVQLQLLPEQGQGLNLTLDKSLLYLLGNLVEQSLASTGWELPALTAARQTLH